MKVKEINIEISDLSKVLNEFKEVAQAVIDGKKVKPRPFTLSFSDLATMRRFLTQNRLHLLHLIKTKKPKSIQELAQLADRDFKNVYEDLKILKNFELVEFSKDKYNLKNQVPHLLYSGLKIHLAF